MNKALFLKWAPGFFWLLGIVGAFCSVHTLNTHTYPNWDTQIWEPLREYCNAFSESYYMIERHSISPQDLPELELPGKGISFGPEGFYTEKRVKIRPPFLDSYGFPLIFLNDLEELKARFPFLARGKEYPGGSGKMGACEQLLLSFHAEFSAVSFVVAARLQKGASAIEKVEQIRTSAFTALIICLGIALLAFVLSRPGKLDLIVFLIIAAILFAISLPNYSYGKRYVYRPDAVQLTPGERTALKQEFQEWLDSLLKRGKIDLKRYETTKLALENPLSLIIEEKSGKKSF